MLGMPPLDPPMFTENSRNEALGILHQGHFIVFLLNSKVQDMKSL